MKSYQNMTIEELTRSVVDMIRSRAADDDLVEVVHELRDGRVFTAVTVGKKTTSKTPGDVPTMILDTFLEQIRNETVTVEDIVNFYFHIEETFENDFQQIKDRITIRMVNADMVRKSPFRLVHRDFLDLSAYYVIDMDRSQNGRLAASDVTPDHLEKWGITEDELLELAIKNTERIYPATLTDMAELWEHTESIYPYTLTDMVHLALQVCSGNTKPFGVNPKTEELRYYIRERMKMLDELFLTNGWISDDTSTKQKETTVL